MTMKVLLINGSPNKEGCTYNALNHVAKALNDRSVETEIIYAGSSKVGGCMSCGGCNKTGKCVYDDAVNLVIEKSKDADGFIFGTPVHYASPSGSMISFMDRLFYAGGARLKFKPASIVISTRRAGATAAFDVMLKYPTINQMPVVSADYWPMVHGHSAPSDVFLDAEGIHTMESIARNMAWMLKCIDAGRQVGIEPEVVDKMVWTHFIR